MTTQPPTTAGTWAPDISAIADMLCGLNDYRPDREPQARAIVAEIERQAAAAGFVLVSATDLRVLLDHFTGFGDAYAEACKARLDAAMPEHPEGTRPGGDES